MKKYYTMKECFDECGDDDIPYDEESGFNCGFMFTKKEMLERITAMNIGAGLSEKWQIKRAEKKVMTADEWLEERYSRGGVFDEEDMKYAYDNGIVCGRHKEYDRPEQVELRKAVYNLLKCYPAGKMRLESAFENLKPPYEKSIYQEKLMRM